MLKKIILLISSIIISIIAVEIIIRILPYLHINSMGRVMRPDPILDHSMRPYSTGRMKSKEYNVLYKINSIGFRDDEPHQGGIIILGDSFMEGYGVERGSVLADKLRSYGFTVNNFGTKSYSPLLEYLLLKQKGLELQPDTILLFFDLSDPANDEYYYRRAVFDSQGKPTAIFPRQAVLPLINNKFGEWLDLHSGLYAYYIHFALKYFPASDADVGYAGIAKGMDPLFTGRDSIPDSDYYRRWDTSLMMIKEIRSLCIKNNISFGIISYPYGHQVSEDAWSEGRKGHGFPKGISSDRPFRFLEKWCESEKIPVLSLDKTFRAYPSPKELYFNFDGHWTAKGHKVAADAVKDWLTTGMK